LRPDRPDEFDFEWTDDRLSMLRERGIEVVGGLLHHGSGPHYTELLDPEFPAKLAHYAERVAERYPWIDMWTPVNEPLTTARFSGPLRSLVPASEGLFPLPPSAGQSVQGHARGDEGDPQVQPGREARADRGPRQMLLDGSASLSGCVRE
jgi:hypothetical protein